MVGKPGLLGVDGQRGIIYAQMDGAGRMQLELRGLENKILRDLFLIGLKILSKF